MVQKFLIIMFIGGGVVVETVVAVLKTDVRQKLQCCISKLRVVVVVVVYSSILAYGKNRSLLFLLLMFIRYLLDRKMC